MVEYAGIIIGVTVCVIGVLIAVCWYLDRVAHKGIDDFDAYGDASETPKMMSNCRRANHAKRR